MEETKFKQGDTVISYHKKFLVLVTSEATKFNVTFDGVVLRSNQPEDKPIGYFSKNWRSDYFSKVQTNLNQLTVSRGDGYYFAKVSGRDDKKVIIQCINGFFSMHGSTIL